MVPRITARSSKHVGNSAQRVWEYFSKGYQVSDHHRATTGRSSESTAGASDVVIRNIRALVLRRKQEERSRGYEERIADVITRFTGSMAFVYLHVVLFAGWIVVNLGWTPLPVFDKSLVLLAMIASVEAIFLSTFVLISQNRMAALADKRADLDLQISLLAEHEVTRLLGLVSEIAKKMGVEGSDDPQLNDLVQDTVPEKVLDEMEKTERQFSRK